MIEKQSLTQFQGEVTIDETLWTHAEIEGGRTNWSRHESQQWVVGLVHLESGDAKVYLVPDRTAETLRQVI
jgi:hypothetical protein